MPLQPLRRIPVTPPVVRPAASPIVLARAALAACTTLEELGLEPASVNVTVIGGRDVQVIVYIPDRARDAVDQVAEHLGLTRQAGAMYEAYGHRDVQGVPMMLIVQTSGLPSVSRL